MAKRLEALIDRLIQRRSRRDWHALADTAGDLTLPDLKRYRQLARRLNQPLNRFLHEADHRLAQPIVGSNAIETPIGTDWSWRPDMWRGPVLPRGQASLLTKTRLGEQLTVFHDCPLSEVTYRQTRNISEFDLAPFGLRLDVFQFRGSFLSLSIAMPAEMVADLGKRHILQMNAVIETEKPLEIFTRLNVRHGPNVDQHVRELPLYELEQVTEFDLANSFFNNTPVNHLWVDIIFEEPTLNQITLRDVTFNRRPRADL